VSTSKPQALGVDELRRLIAATAGVTGDDFFRALVKTIGELLGMRRVFVGELRGARIRPLAAWRDRADGGIGALFEMAEYDLEGTARGDLLTTHVPLSALELGIGFADGADGLAHVCAAVRRGDGEVLGVLCALGEQDAVAATQTEIFALFAERAAAEVERARAEVVFRARTEARLRHQSALVELAQLRTTTVESALQIVLPVAGRTLGTERTSYWSLVDHDEAIECEQLYTLSSGESTRGGRLAAITYPSYFKALRACHAIDASDAANDPRTAEFRVGYFDTLGIGALLDVPVWRTGRLVGVLCFEHVGGSRTWSLEEHDFATSVAAAVSVVLEASARTRAEERYRLVSQVTGEAVWEWDLRTDYISWNEALRTVFRHDVDLEMFDGGKWWKALVHPEERARVEAAIHAIIEGNTSAWTDEYRFLRGDGTIAHVLDRGFVTRDEAGRAIRMTGSMQDVTARKALEHRLLLADRMASMGTLAAGVAHEINNPLAYVKGNLDYVIEKLAAETTIDPDVVLALEDARTGSNRVREIVRDLKMFSRADLESRGPVDVESVVKSSIAMASNEIRHRARLVRREGNPPPVLATEARLGQVVLNLLVNAAQAIPEAATESNEIRVETGVAADGRVFIEVADTGPGITREVQRRMFDPFFTTKAIGEGTGLGLAICHSIVTELGGEIAVESEPGRGATFRVLLRPAVPITVVEASPLVAADQPRRARVLVVDDDPNVAVAVKRILGRDHDVVVSSGGGDALARLMVDPSFDVVVCDVMMPEVSGMDVYGELARRMPDLTRKILFMTGGAFTPLAREFLATTPQPCIEKPFEPDELRRTVAAILS
jgi:PAS domain S-box-containing protein